MGIERVFYAMKWAKHAEDRRHNTDIPDGVGPLTTHDSGTESTQETGPAAIPHPRPSFRDSDVHQPPDVDPAAEKKLEGLKSKILKLYTHHKTPDRPNVTSSVRMDLKHMRDDDDIVIKQSDKCKSFVLMNKGDYV